MKKHIPNLFTLSNLFCGSIAVFFAVNDILITAAYFVFAGLVFDFFDGFVARLLKVQSSVGKELDSLADVVTFGLVPGVVLVQLLYDAINSASGDSVYTAATIREGVYFPLLGLVVTLSSAYRLARFNLDTRQSQSFIGLPTPANALAIVTLPFIPFYGEYLNQWLLAGLVLLSSFLLNSNLPLFALKFKSYNFKENGLQYVFLLLGGLLLVFFKLSAVPLIILLYVVLSILFYRKSIT